VHADWHFRFHDLVTVRIQEKQSIVDRLLARPGRGYIHHRIDPGRGSGPPPDIDIRIGPFEYQHRPAVYVNRRFRVDRDYFACEDTSKILWWKVEIAGFEGNGPARVRVDKNIFGTAALGSRIFDCLIRYHLNLRQAPAVHGCGVSAPKGVVLFVGSSGVGKSSIAMRMLETGIPLLGDNWIILKNGRAFGFHLPINVHDYNIPDSLYRRFPVAMRLDIQFKKYCRVFSGGYLKKSCPVVLKRMFPGLAAEQGPIVRIVSLIQGETFQARAIGRDAVIRRMLATDMMDREAFYRYMLAYATRFAASPIATHWQRLVANLDSALPQRVETYELTLPKMITPDILDRIVEYID
jgi:hypothetical protein